MNEAENFYDNASKIGGRLSSIQQREEEGREASVDIARTKWDTLLGQDTNAMGEKEGEGGAETGGGLTTSLLVAGVKKVVSGRVKGALQKVVQNKIDSIKANKASSNVETKAPAPDDAPARSPADLDIQSGQSVADSRSQASNLSDRMNNMDSASKQSVMDEYNSDPARVQNPSTPADYENNVRTMEGKVKAQESNPETKFQDENLGSDASADAGTGTDATASVGNTTTTSVAQQTPRTQAQDDAQLGGDTDDLGGGATNTPVSSTQVQTGSTNTGANTGNPAVDDTLDNISDTAGNISQKGMDVLTDKLGVDFGDLAPADIGGELAGAVGEASGSMLGAIGGAVGTALDFLGPIGMLLGLGTTIFGLSEDAKTESDSSKKQSQIETLAGSVNDMGGMSMGSIASTPMDTAQIRGGGASLNF